jgi:hypothetical protein
VDRVVGLAEVDRHPIPDGEVVALVEDEFRAELDPGREQ